MCARGFDIGSFDVYNRHMTLGVRFSGSMALLVSVADADEATAALEGGADVIDAKDPTGGALGPVRPDVLTVITGTVRGRAIVTAALGDASDVHRTERLAAEYSGRGASLLKVGFAGVADARRVDALLAAAVRGCVAGSGVVAVAYADCSYAACIDPWSLVEVAVRSGARGVLVDTADKLGDGLTSLWNPSQLASWVAEARSWGLIAAVAGKLGESDFAIAREAGADIVGVRGAACVGERTSRVSADRVRLLRARLDDRSILVDAPAIAAVAESGSSV